MTIEEMRAIRQKYGYTYAQISKISGVPVGTLQKIFRGETVSPRYETAQAMERAFAILAQEDELRETVFYGEAIPVKYGCIRFFEMYDVQKTAQNHEMVWDGRLERRERRLVWFAQDADNGAERIYAPAF